MVLEFTYTGVSIPEVQSLEWRPDRVVGGSAIMKAINRNERITSIILLNLFILFLMEV